MSGILGRLLALISLLAGIACLQLSTSYLNPGAMAQTDLADLEAEIIADVGRGDIKSAHEKSARFLEWARREKGEKATEVGDALKVSGLVQMMQGDHATAEASLKRAMEIFEQLQPRDELRIGIAVQMLGAIFGMQGRTEDAKALLQRGSRMMSSQQSDAQAAADMVRMSELSFDRPEDFAEMEAISKRMIEKLVELGQDATSSRLALASLYAAHDRCADAESTLGVMTQFPSPTTETLKPLEQVMLGDVLGKCLTKLGAYEQAERVLVKSLVVGEAVFGPRDTIYGGVLVNLTELMLGTGRTEAAIGFAKRLVDNYGSRLGGDSRALGRGAAPLASRHAFHLYLDALWFHRAAHPESATEVSLQAFRAMQMSTRSVAGDAIAQLGIRWSSAEPGALAIIRQWQDARQEWQSLNVRLLQKISVGDEVEAARLRGRMKGLVEQVEALDAELIPRFPQLASLIGIGSITIEEVQSQLAAHEALIVIVPTTRATHVWAITQKAHDWRLAPINAKQVEQAVRTLRCGLDATGWTDGDCEKTGGLNYSRADLEAGKSLPFDRSLAHSMYAALLGELEGSIEGKDLLFVAGGALTQLPMHVLVTNASSAGIGDQQVGWLVRRHAVSILPSVESLQSLRRDGRRVSATKPFIGFGNPVLDGNPDCARNSIPRACPEPSGSDGQVEAGRANGQTKIAAAASYFRNGSSDIGSLKKLCPLPETEFELRCIAGSFGRDATILVGSAMTESTVKGLPLDIYQVIHFATHGLVSGEVEELSRASAEPALVMSPPANPSEHDDGLLTASEIASLKLDASWVVMSACNTAAAGAREAEALSGLAKAFFYAGSRALLVSHWPVHSYAATLLTTRTFATLQASPDLGRARAFRRAVLSLIDDPQRPRLGHPALWAPFVVVGEGGVGR